ncbi:MAG: phage capsid protein [Streptosporangiaceae bacterium]|nr:phage capsid protein [Streptosporangiaceae bacterium]
MASQPARSSGDQREDTAAAVAAAVGAIFAAVEVAILERIADLARRTLTGRLVPGIARRRLAQAITAIYAEARPRINAAIRDGMTGAAGQVRDILTRDVAHMPPDTAQTVTSNVILFPTPAGSQPAESLTAAIQRAEATAQASAQSAFQNITASAPATTPQIAARPRPTVINPYRQPEDVYGRAVRSAIEDTRGGMPYSSLSLSRVQAAQKALDSLAEQGITGFVDTRGRAWNLASYVEMATRTAVSAAWDNMQGGALSRAGLDLVIVGTHSSEGSCPACLPWLGKVLSLAGAETGLTSIVDQAGAKHRVTIAGTVDQARASGFRHPNCRCDLIPYLNGMDVGQVDWFAVPHPQAAAVYEASQRQRALERHVRDAARRRAVAVTPAARRAAQRDLDAARLASETHRKATGLRMTHARVRRREDPFRAF